MITRRGAPKTLATPLATRLSAALRSLIVFFVFIYHTIEIQSTHTQNGWRICLRFTQGMAGVAWRLKSDWGSRPPSLGAYEYCRALILRPLASVCMTSLSLVENLGTARRWDGRSNSRICRDSVISCPELRKTLVQGSSSLSKKALSRP